MTIDTHPEIEGLTLFMAPLGAHHHAVHAHDGYSVICITGGSKLYHHNGTSVPVHAGEIAIANPGIPHGCEPLDETPWSHKTWYVSKRLMAELSVELLSAAPIELATPKIVDDAVFTTLIDAHDTCQAGDILDRQSIAIEALSTLIGAYGKREEPKAAEPPLVKETAESRLEHYVALMTDEMDSRLNLQKLAACADVSRNQVIRDFRRVTGATPGAFYRHLRLDRAKQLIKDGASLSEAASGAGFSDQSHFTRCFKGAYGVTPAAYEALLAKSASQTAF